MSPLRIIEGSWKRARTEPGLTADLAYTTAQQSARSVDESFGQ